MLEIYMVVGFMLAAYSIIANDAIQTLGDFYLFQQQSSLVDAMAVC